MSGCAAGGGRTAPVRAREKVFKVKFNTNCETRDNPKAAQMFVTFVVDLVEACLHERLHSDRFPTTP